MVFIAFTRTRETMRQQAIAMVGIFASGGAMMLGGAIASTPTLEGTNWQLSGWTGNDIAKGTEITLSFQGKNLAGSSGCNRYVGGYQTEGERFSVKSELASTMMACPEPKMQQETRFINALKGVREYAINSAGELQLVYRLPSGLGILTFTPDRRNTSSPKK